MSSRPQAWTLKHEMACRMIAMGQPTNDVLLALFGTDVSNETAVNGDRKKLAKLRAHKEWDVHYSAFLKERLGDLFGRAVGVMERQLDEQNGWLANKAANDIAGLAKADLLGQDEKQLTIKVEGMPELGTPDSSN